MQENEHWSKLKLDPNRKRSYETDEMYTEKFNKTIHYVHYKNAFYNFPDLFYDGFSCFECKNLDKCPAKIKKFHNMEASINRAIGEKGYGLTGPAWCMGTLGYNNFEMDWDKEIERL